MITVVGIGEDSLDGLALTARNAIEGADVLVGGDRHLSKVPDSTQDRLTWENGFDAAFDEIDKRGGQRIVILASGDPMNLGVGVNVVRRFGADAVTILPAPGAFSLAAARMGWPLAETECLTVHGRALEAINLYLVPGRRLLVLSWDGSTPAKLAALLAARGFGQSQMTVLANMGGEEARHEASAENWSLDAVADLNTIAIECTADADADTVAGADTGAWSRVPGLPDDAYQHDGQITKREVRAVTLSRLSPLPGQVLWDVGAGSCAIGIEWLRAEPNSKVFAVERDTVRIANIIVNAANLGVPKLTIIEGEAPDALSGIEMKPDAVFLGGGVSVPGLLEICWQALNPGGRLVANAVTVKAEQALLSFQNEFGGDLVRLAVSRTAPVGSHSSFQPLKQVTQLAVFKK